MPIDKIPNPGQSVNRPKNLLINGDFLLWTRTTSLTAASSKRYAADKWYTNAVGSTVAVSQQAFGIQTNVPNNPAYFHRVVVVSSAGASNYAQLVQPIENAGAHQGQTVSLSFWAKADASKTIGVSIDQNMGSGGSATVNNSAAGTASLTTSWQWFNIVYTIPVIAGTLSTSFNTSHTDLIFWLDAGSSFNSRSGSIGQQSGTFDIARVQLEYGSSASDFEILPVQQQIFLCERYYQNVHFRNYGYTQSAGNINFGFTYRQPMVVTPTLGKVSEALDANTSSVVLVSSNAYGGYANVNSAGSGYAGSTTLISADSDY